MLSLESLSAQRPWTEAPPDLSMPRLPGAACKGMDGEQFLDLRRQVDAKAVCAACPARQDCLAWCVARERLYGQEPGVWGGLTPEERRPIVGTYGRRCKNDLHFMTEDNLLPYITPGGKPSFECRKCANASNLRSKKKRRGQPLQVG